MVSLSASKGDTTIVKSARNIQRDLIEVSTEKPALKPERMYTWIYKAKNIPVVTINRDLRILPSKDGEMSITEATNQIIITDWVSNLNRVVEILKQIDVPTGCGHCKTCHAGRRVEFFTSQERTCEAKK